LPLKSDSWASSESTPPSSLSVSEAEPRSCSKLPSASACTSPSSTPTVSTPPFQLPAPALLPLNAICNAAAEPPFSRLAPAASACDFALPITSAPRRALLTLPAPTPASVRSSMYRPQQLESSRGLQAVPSHSGRQKTWDHLANRMLSDRLCDSKDCNEMLLQGREEVVVPSANTSGRSGQLIRVPRTLRFDSKHCCLKQCPSWKAPGHRLCSPATHQLGVCPCTR
jgi:hypothetical protein